MALTIRSTLSELIADERSKDILSKRMPGLLDDPRIGMAMGMTLDQIAPFSGGKITQQLIDDVAEDLAQL
ncbi:MAG: hypothetical protein ACP5SH_16450 [Syntrophobacteraceae bacterium]